MESDMESTSKLTFDGRQRLRALTHLEPVSGSSTPIGMKGSLDPLRSESRRRVWASHLFEDADFSPTPPQERVYDSSKRPFPPDSSVASSSTPDLHSLMRFTHLPSNGFFRTLRNHSFGRFTSPFQSTRREEKKPESGQQESTWSSDSSELDDEFDFMGDDYADQYNFRGPVLSSSREL